MARSVNKVILVGNVVRDPETKKVGEKTMTTFSVATNRGEDSADFHRLVAWEKLGDICAQFLAKGRKVYVEGRLQYREYEKDGVKKSLTEIVLSDMMLLGSKNEGQQQATTDEPAPSSAPVEDELDF